MLEDKGRRDWTDCLRMLRSKFDKPERENLCVGIYGIGCRVSTNLLDSNLISIN
jgi:hypothetical protein